MSHGIEHGIRLETNFRRIEMPLEQARDLKAKFRLFPRTPRTVVELERLKETLRPEDNWKRAAHGTVAVWQTSPLEVAPGWRGELPDSDDNIVKEHWHNIYVGETVPESVRILRIHGIELEYTPRSDAPEEPNAYMARDAGVISSCVRWRSGNMPGIPARAMACLQLLSSARDFETICYVAEKRLTIIQSCACAENK